MVQNGNAYDEGLNNDFWKPLKAYWKEPNSKEKRNALRGFLTYKATMWQYTHGVKNPELISPDGPAHDQFLLDRPGNDEIQLDLYLSYGSNPPLYPKWQAYFRKHQPPVLIVWGKNDQIFPAAGAEPYKRDLKTIEYHLLDAGHFALETNGDEIARLMRKFLDKHVAKMPTKPTQEPITGREELDDLSKPTQALAQFYPAINNRDLDLMAENWSQSDEAVMDNPVGNQARLAGNTQIVRAPLPGQGQVLLRVLRLYPVRDRGHLLCGGTGAGPIRNR